MNTRAQTRPHAAARASFFIVAAGALVLAQAHAAAAKSWRGIVPLVTTRAGVERLLGRPARKGDGWHFYDLRDEAAFVWFADGACDPWGLRWDVPEGTVTHVGVVPKRRVKISTLLDPSAAVTERATRDYAVHRDTRAGIVAEAQGGHVVVATYEPGRADSSRRCPARDKSPPPVPHQFPFDQYGRLTREDEWARLDNYANALFEWPAARGVVVAYGGRRGRRGEARVRAARAKSYLVRKRGIEPWRITTIDGGYSEELRVDLQILQIGSTLAPLVAPVVPPEEVEFVGRARGRRRTRPRAVRRRN